jgi:hypothetical protein
MSMNALPQMQARAARIEYWCRPIKSEAKTRYKEKDRLRQRFADLFLTLHDLKVSSGFGV